MKLTTFLMIVCCLQIHASVRSQYISFSGKNVSLETVFSAIEQQTGYTVAGKLKVVKDKDPVTIEASEEPLKLFLSRLLDSQGIGFTIRKKSIVLYNKVIVAPPARKETLPGITEATLAVAPPVKGRVTDSLGNPLAGASVKIKGSSKGVKTDGDGNFSIDVKVGQTLEISFVGYGTLEIPVENLDMLNITLSRAESSLEQLVVIGYGAVKERDLTGAVSTIKGEDISSRNEMQLSVALQGLVPGVSVTRNSSIPGSSSTGTIRVRGVTTIGNSNPLILVDGVEVEDIDRINPNDIENISVLKDASAASIYGSRAAAGVLLITTKKPKDRKSVV